MNDMQELEKILDKLEKLTFEAEVYNDDFDGVNIGNLICLGDVREVFEEYIDAGWILVEERMPEENVEVLVTYADVDNGKETGIEITTYGHATLGGNKLDFKEWRNPFSYFKRNYREIAWRPLLEPYFLEEGDKDD